MYKKLNALLPENLEGNFRRLSIRWSALRERTLLNRADSDSSIEETLATGNCLLFYVLRFKTNVFLVFIAIGSNPFEICLGNNWELLN